MSELKKFEPLMLTTKILLACYFILSVSCSHAQDKNKSYSNFLTDDDINTGAEQTEIYFPWIQGKKIGIVANHTSRVNGIHLLDTLLSSGMIVKKIFSPEHGFRGIGEAGEHIENGLDKKTGVPLISLYGDHRKPTKEDLHDIEAVLIDLQDVGTRFYTYISTMTLVMEACAENGVQVIVLDRPNPNGFYVDGPVLKPEFSSFVGMHPVPVVHGMTMAEYATMLNGEGWLKDGIQCELITVKTSHYKHKILYQLPLRPSPNLPNMISVYLYPSLAFFEGTDLSIGRGTDFPFQVIGHPEFTSLDFSFTPRSIPGASTNPKQLGNECFGFDLRDFGQQMAWKFRKIYIYWLLDSYNRFEAKDKYFNSYFDKLAGSDQLRNQLINGATEKEIYESWEKDLTEFKKLRKKYLLYPDFE